MKREAKRVGIFFLINTLIVFLTFGGFVFNEHFSSDDFFCYYDQSGEGYAVTYSSYRLVLGFIYEFLNNINVNVVEYQIGFGAFMLICFSVAVTALSVTLMKIISPKDNTKEMLLLSAIDIGSLMIIINVFISEWMWFTLAYVQWGLAVLSSVTAAILIVKNKNKVRAYILSFVLLFIAAGCYQISISIYVFVVMFYIFCIEKGKISLNAVKLTLKAALPAIVSIILNIVITKILVCLGGGYSGSRMELNFENIINKLQLLLRKEIAIWKNGMGLMPEYFMAIVALGYIVLIIFNLVKKKNWWNLLSMFVVLLAGFIVMCLPLVLQDSFYQPARMVVPLMCVFMVLHLNAVCLLKENSRQLVGLLVTGGLFLTVNFVEIQQNTFDCIKTNAIEQRELEAIVSYLNDYETNNHVSITNIAFVKDDNPTYKYYQELKNATYSGEMATRSLLVSWSDIQIVNYYFQRTFHKVEVVDESIKEVFEKSDYNYFAPDKQIYISDDTAYIFIY